MLFSVWAMASVWGAWGLGAWITDGSYLVYLPKFCNLMVLTSALSLTYNLIPGLWMTHPPEVWGTIPDNTGSLPYVFFLWAVLSYLLGIFVIIFELYVLEGLCAALEWTTVPRLPKPWRSWRGNFQVGGAVIWSAYNWGFFSFWLSTAAAVYLFNNHKEYVPPFNPLHIFGLLTGSLSLLLQLLSAPSPKDEYHLWIRARATEIHNFMYTSPWHKDRKVILKVS